MKNYKRIKRFGAAATAIAMLGTLSVGVFADEADVVEETVPEVVAEEVTDETVLPEVVKEVIEAPVAVEDEAEAVNAAPDNLLKSNQLDITEVTATKLAIAGTPDQYNYTINLKYKFKEGVSADGKQVAMVGYIFDGTATDAAEGTIDDAAKVYAIDQLGAASEGSFTVKMTSKSDAPKMVANDAVLILKIGSDAVADGGAQAVAVDLANAAEVLDFTAVYAEAETASYAATYGDTLDQVKAKLADTIKATVYANADKTGNKASGYATKDWAVKTGEFTGEIGSKCTFEGTVVADAEAGGKFTEGDLKVTVEVTVPALTNGDVTVKPKNPKKGDSVTAGLDKFVESITVKSGNVEDTYAVNSGSITYAWDGDALDTSAEGNKATLKVTINGVSANGKFDLTDKVVTVEITVVAAISGTYGDVDGLNGVDNMDWMYILDYTSGGNGFEGLDDPNSRAYKAADVDKINGIDDMDWMYILDYTSGGIGHENINTNF